LLTQNFNCIGYKLYEYDILWTYITIILLQYIILYHYYYIILGYIRFILTISHANCITEIWLSYLVENNFISTQMLKISNK